MVAAVVSKSPAGSGGECTGQMADTPSPAGLSPRVSAPQGRYAETRQRGLAGQDDMFAARCDAGQIAHELERIPQSLLGVDEQGLCGNGVPSQRGCENAGAGCLGAASAILYSRQPC